MPFCASCGSQVEGSFCAKCGTKVGAAAPGAGPAVQATGAMADNVASALCYVLGLITGIIFPCLPLTIAIRRIRFHAFQSIFLNVACIVGSIVINVVLSMLHLGAVPAHFAGHPWWFYIHGRDDVSGKDDRAAGDRTAGATASRQLNPTWPSARLSKCDSMAPHPDGGGVSGRGAGPQDRRHQFLRSS